MTKSTDATTGTIAPGSVPPSGTRPFVLDKRRRESETIVSFVLRPTDGDPPAAHIAGQHLTLFAEIPGAGLQKRNFTLSAAPDGATYRISVKREAEGIVSPWLHDSAAPGTTLAIASPSGCFVLPEPIERPIVMVSAGVGATPMIAMLEAFARHPSDVAIQYVHCTQHGGTHAFGDHVRALAAAAPSVAATTFYTRPREQDEPGRDFDVAGRLTVDWLAAHTPLGEAEFFVCGPLGFLRDIVSGLAARGVGKERLHYEFFGPVEDLFDEAGASAPPAPQAGPPVAARHSRLIGGLTRAQIGDALLDSAADAVVASDAEGTIVLWNAGAERIFGFTEAEALGQSLDIIIPEPFRQRHWDGYRETVASGQSRYGAGDMLAVPGLRKDGTRNSLEFTIVLLAGADGRVSGMVATIRDVTARFEETKALKKKLKELAAGPAAST